MNTQADVLGDSLKTWLLVVMGNKILNGFLDNIIIFVQLFHSLHSLSSKPKIDESGLLIDPILATGEKRLEMVHQAPLPNATVVQLSKELEYAAVRSRGPGGQNVNKVSSAAVLYWDVRASTAFSDWQKSRIFEKLTSTINKQGQVFVRSDEFRDLERNKQRCFEKLLQMLSQALYRPKKRVATRPTYSSKMRKRVSKTIRSETKARRRKVDA